MHQTFYISPDEEIISIISKIKKSPSAENILVVSPGALILQSIVNLRLLKKESEKLNKQIMIVAQNEQSRRLIEKAGILAQSSLEEVESNKEPEGTFQLPIDRGKSEGAAERVNNKKRLANIGSKEFFNGQTSDNVEIKESRSERMETSASLPRRPASPNRGEQAGAKEDKLGRSGRSNKKVNVSDILETKRESIFPNPSFQKPKVKKQDNFNLHKEKEIEKLFGAEKYQNWQKKDSEEKPESPVPGKIKKVFAIFAVTCFVLVLALGSYLIFPKAKISVVLKTAAIEDDLTIEGDNDALVSDLEKRIIPATVIKKEDSLSLSFSATGKSSASDKKARGVIAIYNEYGSAAQPLVATTRFLTPDGKLFRLTKGVTVPGMAEVNRRMEPGIIEAEVIADESGEEYNIGPSDFSIPGFESSPKYEKFYARSSHSMAGGGLAGSKITVVSQENIDLAKSKLESTLENKIEEKIKEEAGEGKIVLSEAVKKAILESAPSLRAGVAADNFNYQAKMEMEAMVFSQEDLIKMAKEIFEEKREQGNFTSGLDREGIEAKISRVEIEYGQSDADFESGKIAIKASAKAILEPEIDLENLKKELLGKNDAQVREVLRNYPQAEKIEIEYWPKFFSREIPRFGKRVEVKAVLEG